MNSSLLPGRIGSLSTMLFSFIRSVHHILLHLITEFKKPSVTFLFMPKCHLCTLWVDYPFRIRHAAAGTDTTLFKNVYLFFSSFQHCTYILSPFIVVMDKTAPSSSPHHRIFFRKSLQLSNLSGLRIVHSLNSISILLN